MGTFALRLIMLALLFPATHAFCQDVNPPIYSEVIPTSSRLPYDPATDTRESFQAPTGMTRPTTGFWFTTIALRMKAGDALLGKQTKREPGFIDRQPERLCQGTVSIA